MSQIRYNFDEPVALVHTYTPRETASLQEHVDAVNATRPKDDIGEFVEPPQTIESYLDFILHTAIVGYTAQTVEVKFKSVREAYLAANDATQASVQATLGL